MKLAHTLCLSVGLHGVVVWLTLHFSVIDLGGLAQPPVTSLRATLLTYQKGETAHQATPQRAAVALDGGGADKPPILTSDAQIAPRIAAVPASAPLAAHPGVEKAAAAASVAEVVVDSASLDVSPTLVSQVTLEYPPAASGREGLVTLALTIGMDGKVDEVNVIKAIPVGFFEAAAITGFKNARFTPGVLRGVGVKSRLVIEVEFMPTNRGATVAGQK